MKSSLCLYFILVFNVSFSQIETVKVEFDRKFSDPYVYNPPAIYKIEEKGLFVAFNKTHESNGKMTTSSNDLAFYDADLRLVWSISDVSSSAVNHLKNYDLAKAVSNENVVHLSPNNKYCFIFNRATKVVTRIDMKDGSAKEAVLSDLAPVKNATTNVFLDNDFLYLVTAERNSIKTGMVKERHGFSIVKIDAENLSSESFSFETKSVGEKLRRGPNSATRNWIFIGASSSLICLADNYTIIDEDSKKFYRNVVAYSYDGGIVFEKKFEVGSKIADRSHIGQLLFNPFGQGNFYTYAISKKGGETVQVYRSYDSNAELNWEQQHPYTMKIGGVKKSIGYARFDTNDNGELSITSSYGNDQFELIVSPEEEFNFLTNSHEDCESQKKYQISCFTFQKLLKNTQCASFLKNDMKKEKRLVRAEAFYFDKTIVIAKVPSDVVLGKTPFYELYSFTTK